MKKAVCVILFLVLLLCAAGSLAGGTPQPVLDARASVVRIFGELGDEAWVGSGFAVGTPGEPIEYIVTNDHVGGDAGARMQIFSGDYASTGATLAFTLPEVDLAVLKLDTPIYGMAPLPLWGGDAGSLVGQPVYALGFPGSADRLFEKSDTVVADVSITDGIVSAVKKTQLVTGGKSATSLQMNVSIYGGNSGGPLLDETGAVVGVNTFGSVEDTNMNAAISISELLNTLNQKGIPYADASQVPQPSLLPYILGGAGVLAVVAVVIVLLARRRKKAKQQPAPQKTLASVLGGDALSFEMALQTLLPVFQTVEDREAAGAWPLNIYPQNIGVSDNGQTSLFGVQTQITAGYSAPEQYKESGIKGGWTDVYQLGAALYALTAGSAPPDVLSRYEQDAVPGAIDALAASPAQKDALKQALSLKAADRFTGTRAFMEALGIAGLPRAYAPAATAADTDRPAKKQCKKLSKKAKRVLSVALPVAGAAVVFGVLLFMSYSARVTATGQLEQRQFRQAAATLEKVPPIFGDKNLENLKGYAAAGILFESGDYENAQAAFAKLGGFGAAPQMAEKSGYLALTGKAARLIRDGSAEAGEQIFLDLKTKAETDAEKQELDYLRGLAYANAGETGKAIEIFAELGDYSDSPARLAEALSARTGEFVESGDYLHAYKSLVGYENNGAVKKMMDELIPYVYAQGVSAFDAGREIVARECFSTVDGYGESASYLRLLNTDHVFDLIPYLGNLCVDERVYNEPMLGEYLKGTWRGGEYYFSMNNEGGCSYNIPWIDYGDYYMLRNGKYMLYSYFFDTRECFRFTIIDANTMDVYSYKDGSTYRLTRQ